MTQNIMLIVEFVMKQSRNKLNRSIFRGCLRLFDPCIYLKKNKIKKKVGKCRIAVEKISYWSIFPCKIVNFYTADRQQH